MDIVEVLQSRVGSPYISGMAAGSEYNRIARMQVRRLELEPYPARDLADLYLYLTGTPANTEDKETLIRMLKD